MKPHLVLVNPYIEDFAAYDHFSRPYGLWRLSAQLKDQARLTYIDCLNRFHPAAGSLKTRPDGTGEWPSEIIEKPAILADIPRHYRRYGLSLEAVRAMLVNLPAAPEYFLVTSGMTYWYTGLQTTIRLIRSVYPQVPVILGGIYPSLLPKHARNHSGADHVISGQGLDAALQGLSALTGLTLKPLTHLPDENLMTAGAPYAPVMTSDGCIYRCAYCASPQLTSFHQYSPLETAAHLIRLYRHHGIRRFAFYDDALLYRASGHLDIILEELLKAGVKAAFSTPNGLHIRFLGADTASLMKKAGFDDIRLSLESADEDFQKREGFKAARQEFCQAMEILRSAGFERRNIRVYTLANVPGQNLQSVAETIRFASEQGAVPMLAYYSPIPGTPDFEKAGLITSVDEPLFQNNSVYLYRSGIDTGELQQLKHLELALRHSS